PTAYHGVSRDLGDPDLCTAATFDDHVPAVREGPSRPPAHGLCRAPEGQAMLRNRSPLLGRLLLHDRPFGTNIELRPRAVGELLRPPRGSVRAEAPEDGRRREAVGRLEHVQRAV